MSITVLIPTALRPHTSNTGQINCSAANLAELIAHLEQSFPGLRTRLRDERGQVRRFLNFYVNEEDIRFLGGDSYQFRDGDEVMVVPSVAGGLGNWVI